MAQARCALTLALQGVFLALVLAVDGKSKLFFFALFWVAVLVSLWQVLSARRWQHTEFIVFSSIMASILFAVLFAAQSLIDPVGLGVPVIGLSLVAGLLCSIPARNGPAHKSVANQSTRFVGIPAKKRKDE